MLPPEESGYVVLKCKSPPKQCNNYICVPKTWIICYLRDKKAAFGYPSAEEDGIAMKIINKEPADLGWRPYIGQVKYETESYEEAVGYIQIICVENITRNEENSSANSCEDAVGVSTICEDDDQQIEDNSNQKSCEDAADIQTICEENFKQIDENRNAKSCEDAVCQPQAACGESSQQIVKETNASLELVTVPEEPLKIRIVKLKPGQNAENIEKSEKKRHKKHSKEKVHKTRRRCMELLSSTDLNTESCISFESNSQSSESSPKSMEYEISDSVHSVPQMHLKNNNNISYTANELLSESLDANKENSKGILSEDRELVENMYNKIMRYVQFMETTALEIKHSQLIATENKKTIEKLAAKYSIPLHVTDSVETEKMDTQDDDILSNEAQVSEENDCPEENLLVERENANILLESESDDDGSGAEFLPSSRKTKKYKKRKISKQDNRNTLKHPRPAKDLVEIGRNSGIYISAKGLDLAKRTCTGVKQFARQLYREGFTTKALRTCSMTGIAKPALHHVARNVLKNYAMKYGQDMGWEYVEPKELERNLSRLLHNSSRNNLR